MAQSRLDLRMWTTHPTFKDVINKWWKKCDVGGWDGYCFMQRLAYAKGKLWDWNKSTFGNLKVTKEKLCAELIEIDKLAEEDIGSSIELGARRRDVLCSLEGNIKAEEIFWHQKA